MTNEQTPSNIQCSTSNQYCNSTSDSNVLINKSQIEDERRQKMRDRKRIQRLNHDFA